MNAQTATRDAGSTLAEKLGASSGLWAVLWLSLNYLILTGAAADLSASDSEYAAALLAERMRWEWATALRVMGGIMIIWFMGSLAGRLRLVEREPARLASIAFGIGVVWGALWLLSAMFNSMAIILAADYQYAAASRVVGIFAREMILILTPAVVFALALAVSYVAMRFGGFPPLYTKVNPVFTVLLLVLALADWYGPGNLDVFIMALAFAWTGLTSALIIPVYRPPDMVRGTR
jgi:hypothetical protein